MPSNFRIAKSTSNNEYAELEVAVRQARKKIVPAFRISKYTCGHDANQVAATAARGDGWACQRAERHPRLCARPSHLELERHRGCHPYAGRHRSTLPADSGGARL